jgi:peptidoglycan/LPS O-acetylase OafA/YrhL
VTTGGEVLSGPEPVVDAAPERAVPTLRGDIQALRMVAVLSVLVFHLWPDRVAGGYVGVDVFFAISGFLITSHLVRELEDTGRLRLGRFWARRAKRLLPAALLVLLVTAVAVTTLVTVGERSQFLREVVGATFYVENWVLAREAVDYLAADDAASPVQHFWTLSVEEQFYVAVPLVIVACTFLARRVGVRRPTRLVVPVLGAVALASLAYSVLLTAAEPDVAYFSTGTRAWEFVLGGLLGCWMSRPDVVVPRPVAHVLSWGGLAAILVAVWAFDGDTPFPGYAAALPVLGTVAVIAARSVGPAELLGRLRAVRLVGDVSYATYLWHWPLVVLVPFVTDHALTDAEKVAIAGGSIALAWVSTRLVEDPVRFSPRLLGGGRSARTVGLVCAAAMVLVAGTAVAGARTAEHEVAQAQDRATGLVAGTDVRCLGAGAAHGRPAGCPDLGDLIVPAPEAAALDDHNDVECWATTGVSEPQVCHLPGGDPDGPRVLAIGDSHNNVYLPLYESLAKEQGWQVDVTGRSGCSWGTREQENPSAEAARECGVWKERVAGLLASGPAYDVILTTSKQTGGLAVPESGESAEEATVAGLRDAWESQIERGTTVVAIRDNPVAREDVLQCVETQGIDAAEACALPLDRAFAGHDALAEAVRRTPGSVLVDVRDLMCDRVCRPVIGNVAVYRDWSHMTATFVRTLVPTMTERILRALEGARSER